MKNERIGAVVFALLCLAAVANADSSGIGFGAGQSMNPLEALGAARARKAPEALRIIPVGYVAGDDPSAGKPSRDVEWVAIEGGKFKMGTDDHDGLFRDAKPIREVTIRTFEMSKTLVTVGQYAECVAKLQCSLPAATGSYCNWGKTGREHHPINCVDWEQANQFAKFKGARLPTEAEWEYAATGGGRNQKYPWGNEPASCERAVMSDDSGAGCGGGGTMPVCSKPAGNAKFASGGELCDAVGNVLQWVQDKYKNDYAGAPVDGRAVDGTYLYLVLRGGHFYADAVALRADFRLHIALPGHGGKAIGFRLARPTR